MDKAIEYWAFVLEFYGYSPYSLDDVSDNASAQLLNRAITENVLTYTESCVIRDCGARAYELTDRLRRRRVGL